MFLFEDGTPGETEVLTGFREPWHEISELLLSPNGEAVNPNSEQDRLNSTHSRGRKLNRDKYSGLWVLLRENHQLLP
jgi:hypothetical protein